MRVCGVKFKAYPTKTQAAELSQWIGCSRVIYNCKVAEDHKNYKLYKETGESTKPHQAYSHFKTEEREWLRECPSQILRNSSSNWYTAKQRFFKGLSRNPRLKKKGKKDTVLLTNEVFTFKDEVNKDGTISKKLVIGTKTQNLGALKFNAHREYGIPQQIVIGKKAHQWYVSFCYETEKKDKTEAELLEEYFSLDEKSLQDLTIGIDRGITIPFQASNALNFDFDVLTKDKLKIKQRRLKKYQKRLARQKLTSQSRNKSKDKVAKLHHKIANIRHDFAHKVSHALVNTAAKIFAVEDLKLKNMTKKPKAKKNEKGQFIPNGAKAKAGLNRGLLSKGLGKTITFLKYKALQNGKIVIKVPPNYSSQECANCGHIHPENRKTQAEFLCLLCGNQDNADHNAAKVIAKRGVQFLLSKPQAKTRTRLGTSRSKAGRGIHKTPLDLSNGAASCDPRSTLL